MLDYAGGIFIAAPAIGIFLYGLRLAVFGDGMHRIQAIASGSAMMALSGAFALWTVFLR